MLHPYGTLSLVGLSPSNFELSIFDMAFHRKTVRGSIVGTRMDLAECLAFAAEGKVAVHYKLERLENINQIFSHLKAGKIQGRVVMPIS